MTASRTISQLLKAERMSDIIGCIDFARSTSVRVRTSYIHDTQNENLHLYFVHRPLTKHDFVPLMHPLSRSSCFSTSEHVCCL